MKIICVGRNYADHARELKNQIPEEPVLFMKPDTALLAKGQDFYLPGFSNEIHYEAEVVVRIDKMGKHISEKFAPKYYSQISLGLDFTARDLQSDLKNKGLPWEKAKAFDGSAYLGEFINKSELPPLSELPFTLKRNNSIAQQGHTGQMLFSINRLVSAVSQYFTLKVGDLLFTGTPAGVAALSKGDFLELFVNDRLVGELLVK